LIVGVRHHVHLIVLFVFFLVGYHTTTTPSSTSSSASSTNAGGGGGSRVKNDYDNGSGRGNGGNDCNSNISHQQQQQQQSSSWSSLVKSESPHGIRGNRKKLISNRKLNFLFFFIKILIRHLQVNHFFLIMLIDLVVEQLVNNLF
jgi:hypothetical protein